MSDAQENASMQNIGGNLVSVRLPRLGSDEDYHEVLSRLFAWAEGSALAALDWYLSEKGGKARSSRALRVIAVVVATLGAIAPFIAVGTARTAFAFYGYPLLAAGAACVGLDRVFGFSSSWMRYQSAASSLREILVQFQLKWASLHVGHLDVVSREEYVEALELIREFTSAVNDVVRYETDSWVEEFRGQFAKLEAQVEAL